MTTRERSLGLILGAVMAGIACLFGVMQFFYKPLQAHNKSIADLQRDVDAKRAKKLEILQTRHELEQRWNEKSLPIQPEHAALAYRSYLNRMLKDADLVGDVAPDFKDLKAVTKSAADRKWKHMVLPYQVRTRGEFVKIVNLLEKLERTPLAHRVKVLSLHRADTRDSAVEVNAVIHVEALILAWADNKDPIYKVTPDPSRERVYSEISKRDPFVGAVKPPPPPPPPPVAKVEEPPPEDPGPDVRESVKLTTVMQVGEPGQPGYAEEAYLHNRYYGGAEMRLSSRPTSVFSVFRIMNEDRSRALVKGKVLKIDPRGFFFQVGEDIYRMDMHENLARAMRRPLSDDELDEAKIKDRYDANFAEQSKEEEKKLNASKNRKK